MRLKLAAVAVCTASAALLTTPALADASYWRGKTEQGRTATVRTGADGLPSSIRIRWRADCQIPGRRYRDGTRFARPLDEAGPLAFRDGGTYRMRLGDGLRSRIKVHVRGRISANLRHWKGWFRARARVFRNGDRIDQCTVKGVRWRARLRD